MTMAYERKKYCFVCLLLTVLGPNSLSNHLPIHVYIVLTGEESSGADCSPWPDHFFKPASRSLLFHLGTNPVLLLPTDVVPPLHLEVAWVLFGNTRHVEQAAQVGVRHREPDEEHRAMT